MDKVADQRTGRGAAPGRRAIGRPVAIIDIGSTSIPLVAYEGLTRAPTPIYNEKVLCGLGRNVARTGWLDDKAVARALRALARFRVLCDTLDISDTHVLATAAARPSRSCPRSPPLPPGAGQGRAGRSPIPL